MLGRTRGSFTGDRGPTTAETAEALADFRFPDEAWTSVIYDLVLAARRGSPPVDQVCAALVPIYFGRVASHVIENRTRSTDESEESVERQARAFESAKPALVERWRSAS
jgi:hypothetical protein